MNILLVEDHDIAADGITAAMIAEPGLNLAHVNAFEEALSAPTPDVVLLDLALPDVCPLETVSLLRSAIPHARILVISVLDDPDVAIWCLRDGALGIVAKGIKHQTLRLAVETVATGDPFLTPGVAIALLDRLRRAARDQGRRKCPSQISLEVLELQAEGLGLDAIARSMNLLRSQVVAALHDAVRACDSTELTRAQLRVAVGISSGLSNAEIAASVGVQTKTVEKHITQIRNRLDIPEREVRKLAIWAQRAHGTCRLSQSEHDDLYRRRPVLVDTERTADNKEGMTNK